MNSTALLAIKSQHISASKCTFSNNLRVIAKSVLVKLQTIQITFLILFLWLCCCEDYNNYWDYEHHYDLAPLIFLIWTNIKHYPIPTFAGPGIGFVAYPEGIAQMPGASVWAVLFFFMLFTIGLGSQVSRLVILLLDIGRTHTCE